MNPQQNDGNLKPNEGWLTPAEAAQYLQVGIYTLRLWRIRRRSGETTNIGPAFSQIGHRTIRYSREDLDAFASSKQLKTTRNVE